MSEQFYCPFPKYNYLITHDKFDHIAVLNDDYDML